MEENKTWHGTAAESGPLKDTGFFIWKERGEERWKKSERMQ